MTTVRVIPEGFETILLRERATKAASLKALDRTAIDAEDFIEAATARHAKTGTLERSIFKARTAGGWELGHDTQVAPHARFVHDGARPHVIVPRKRKVLRWPGGAQFIFARRVNHPGYSGDAWLRRAAAAAPVNFARHIQNAMQEG